MLAPWKKSYDQTRQYIKKERHYFADKSPCRQSYDFYSSHIWIWELDNKECWASNNWCFWTVVLEKTFESPLDCKEIQSVNNKGNQSWIFIWRTDVEAKAPILWPPDVKNWHWERSWCWEGLQAGREGVDRGWDSWMASLIQWTWVCASSGIWWWTEKPGVLCHGVAKSWAWLSDWTELNWTRKCL